MKTKIKTNSVSELSKFVISKSTEIDSIYKDMCSLIESVVDAWAGEDSKTFINNALNIIKKEKRDNKKIQTFGENLEVVSKNYRDVENAWLENIKMENIDNG